MTAGRIGIMGGTFDPIHIAHLAIAEEARVAFALSRVLFIPAANPPHKQGRSITDARHRLMMVQLATAANPHFFVSAVEMERKGPSYSLLTVQELHEMYGREQELYFITGMDSINELHTWYHPKELLAACHFVGTTRPGEPPDHAALIRDFGVLAETRIHCLDVPAFALSSTDLRARVREGKPIRYLVPEAVDAYIRKEGLYRAHKDDV